MRFAEIDIFGVYVAPISMIMVLAWLVSIALRRIANHFSLFSLIWHPALFMSATYLIIISSIVLAVAR